MIRSGTKITAELIEAAKNLKVIGRAGVGYENIDADAATQRGIVVMNTPGGNNVTTGEHTIALDDGHGAPYSPGGRFAQRAASGSATNSSASSCATKPSASSASATSAASSPNAPPD